MRDSISKIIPYDPGKSVDTLEKEINKPIIRFHANESLWGPAPAVLNFLQEAIKNIMYYPDGGAQELKDSLSEYWGFEKNRFCIGNGTDEIIMMLAAAFLNPGDEALIPIPTFSQYATAVTIAGGYNKFVEQPYSSFKLEEILSQASENTKLVFLCNPNNPTGTIFTHTDLESFLEKLSPETLVILDEAYCQYANDPDFPRSEKLLAKYDNMMVMRTFSKVYSLAALRVGYAVACPKIIEKLEKVRQPFNVGMLAQGAASIAIKEVEYTNNVIKETIKERDWLSKQLAKLDLLVLPSQTNYLLVQFKTKSAATVAEKLLQEGILVRTMASFNLPDWLRISVGKRSSMEKLISVLEDILN